MNYFKDCQTLDEAKKLYYQLALKLHPDKGGKTADFQELQSQFENFKPMKEKFYNEYETFDFKGYEDIINQLFKIPNIIIVIAGSFIWLEGDTKPVKELIKAVKTDGTGFKPAKFAGKKKKWYFAPEGYRKTSKRILTQAEIYSLYGYKDFKTDKEKEKEMITA